MVNINERTVWANLETKVAEPPSTLQNEGYASLEQPYNEHHNWIWNSRDKNANWMIRERNLAQRVPPVISIAQQIGQRYGEENASWVHPYANYSGTNVNEVSFSANQPLCIAPAWDYTRDVPCVYVGREDWNTGLFRLRQSSQGIVEDFITLNFNESTEYVESVVSDGPFFYVMTLGHSSGDAYFYRFSADSLNPVPAWSTSDGGSNFKSGGRNGMCIAGDFLAYVRTNVAAGNNVIRLIRKADAGEFRQGGGNSTSLPSTYVVGQNIVSNGDNVFFEMYDAVGSSNLFLCGANIADPTQATGPTGAWTKKELYITSGTMSGDLVFDGRLVHASSANGLIGTYDWTSNTWDTNGIWHLSNAKDPPLRMEHTSMAYDGFYAWVMYENDGMSSNNDSFIAPVRVSDTAIGHDLGVIPIEISIPVIPEISVGPPSSPSPSTERTKMCYSDNALWIIPLLADSPAGDTKIIRLPNLRERR
jgi:hypothetical protein